MEQPAALCGFSLWFIPLGFPRGEAAERSEADEGWRELESSKIPVEWYKTETNAIYPAAFINKPVAAPHQAFLPIGSEVPLVKKSSFPPGEAKNSKTINCTIQWGTVLRQLRVTKLPTPTGRVRFTKC